MAKSRQRNQSSSSQEGDAKHRKQNQTRSHHSKRGGGGEHHTSSSKDNFKIEDKESPVLPGFTPFIVTAVTLAFRVLYVKNPSNWWMVHPDEVYQSVEVAHIEVYGYGFRTYEYSVPEPLDDVTRYRRMELKADMYGLRSPIFPYFYVIVSWMTFLAGLDLSPYLLWRVAHVMLSSLLPLAVYRYVAKLYKSTDKGSVAAILVAASVHLNVFGTHCLLHSFLAPFTFFALSLLHEDVISADDNASRNANIDASHNTGNGTATKRREYFEDTLNNNINNNNNNNNNDYNFNNNNHHNHQHGTKSHVRVQPHSNGKLQNGVNGHQSIHCESNGDKSGTGVEVVRQTFSHAIFAGFLATLVCYIRPDTILVFASNILLFPRTRRKLFRIELLFWVVGGSGAVLVGLFADICYYGWGIVTPMNWAMFNFVNGLSTTIFGRMSYSFYIEKFFYHDNGILLLTFISLCICGSLYIKRQRETHTKRDVSQESSLSSILKDSNCKVSLSLWSLFMLLGLLLVYSMNGHKEVRFIHDLMVLAFVFIADMLLNIQVFFHSKTVCDNVIRVSLAAFIVTQWRALPDPGSNVHWAYQKTSNVQDINSCINFISKQSDVTGVFYDSHLHMTGGMSLLHHNVPVMSLMDGGFYEFGYGSRKNYTHGQHWHKIGQANGSVQDSISSGIIVKSINEFTSSSNYVAWANAPAAARVIIQRPCYNYVILRRDRKFLKGGFDEVFTTPTNRVLKRRLDWDSEYALQGYLETIPIGTNATVLLHEGDVLFHMGQFDEAAERFYQATVLDERLLEAYMPLEICYRKLGNPQAAQSVRGKCRHLFDEETCTTPRKIQRV